MKTAVIFGLLAVAFASQLWETRTLQTRERSFHTGKHYTYHFDGQIVTGLPQPSSQHSTTRVQSIVSLVLENDRSVLFKMEKTRVGSAHRELVEPRDLQPFGLFEETKMTEEHKEKLALPVRFRYEHGLVSDLEFDAEEMPWSANIKRAVLNMLQINLSKKSRTDDMEMSRVLREQSEEIEQQWPENDFFTTQEMTLEGDCETAYTVIPSGDEKIRVTKSLNFEKCNKRVDIRYNFRFGEECPSCEKKFFGQEQNTESATVFKFELNGNAEEFLIREVELKSHYLFAPLSKEQKVMGTFVANKLTLVKIDEEKNVIRTPVAEKKESLVYSTEWEERLEKFRMTGEEELIRKSPFPWMAKKVEIARHIIKHVEKEVMIAEEETTFTPEMNHQIARLVEVLRVATKEDIKKIEKEMTEEKLRVLFFDILAVAGTKNTVEYLTEKMVERHVSPVKAARLFKTLQDIRNPSEKIIDMIVRVCKDDISERNPIVKQSCWLATGALLKGLCAEQRDRLALEVSENTKPICPRQTKEKYIQLLEKLFERAETRYEKVLALKTIANSGIDLIVFPLEKIIKDKRMDKTVRLQAIDALRQLRSVMPRKLQSILMPLYKNLREMPEIRIAAFHMIMHTLPERAVIDQLTEQLQYERSTQVYSFVYSTLESFIKTDIPCEKEMARDIELSLRLARVQPRKMFDSRLLRASLYNPEYFTGASLNWAVLFSNDSVLPKEVMTSLDTVFAGQWNKYLAQVGFSQQNMDQILYKLIEKIEENESSIEDVIVRGKRSTLVKPAEALRKLMEKMGIQHRRRSEEKAHAMVYLRYKDLDWAVLPIDEELISGLFGKVVRNGKINIGELEHILIKGYRFNGDFISFVNEKTRMIPTTLGLPLEITGKMPTLASIEGEIKAEIEPKNGKGFEGLRLRVRAQPKLATTHIVDMEIRSPLVSTGVKLIHTLDINMPVDAELELNWEKNFDIKFTVRAPEHKKEKRVLSFQSRPITYIRYEAEPKRFESAVEKSVFVPEHPRTEIDYVYGEQLFGLRYNVRGNVHRHLFEKMQRYETLPLLVSENHIEMTMEKTEETPREYIFRMIVDRLGEEMLSEEPEFERFHEDKEVEEHFEVEDSEYVKEDQKERRSAFDKYSKEYKKTARKVAYKYRVLIKAETVGSHVERRGEMEVRSVCDKTFTFCKWTVEASRTPLLEGERRQWQLTASAQTLFPEPIMTMKQLREQKHREMTTEMTAKWGAEEKNTLRIRIQGEQSAEQQKWQKLSLKKEDTKETLNNYEILALSSLLNQIKIVADYKIAPETLVHLGRVSALLKAWKPFTSTVELRSLEKSYQKEGRLLAKLTVEPQTWRYVNLTLETPSERLSLKDMRLPFRPAFLTLEKTTPVERISREYSRKPVCKVSNVRVNTFDDVIFRAPLTTCYSVLAKDCTEEPKFAVLMKNVDKKGEEKKMKIHTEKNIFEIELKKDELVVKVDERIIKKESELNEFNFEKRGDLIVFDNEDLRVRFDGFKAEIEISEYYKNQQCGICGHYDGERDNEFRGANYEDDENMEEFHRSFLLKDDECEMEEEKLSKKDNYKKYEPEYETELESSEETNWEREERREETVEPEMKTRVIEYSGRVCFSKLPVPECPRKFHESEDVKEIKVKFACVERSSTEARRLLREVRREVLSIDHLPNSFVETLTVPKACIAY